MLLALVVALAAAMVLLAGVLVVVLLVAGVVAVAAAVVVLLVAGVLVMASFVAGMVSVSVLVFDACKNCCKVMSSVTSDVVVALVALMVVVVTGDSSKHRLTKTDLFPSRGFPTFLRITFVVGGIRGRVRVGTRVRVRVGARVTFNARTVSLASSGFVGLMILTSSWSMLCQMLFPSSYAQSTMGVPLVSSPSSIITPGNQTSSSDQYTSKQVPVWIVVVALVTWVLVLVVDQE